MQSKDAQTEPVFENLHDESEMEELSTQYRQLSNDVVKTNADLADPSLSVQEHEHCSPLLVSAPSNSLIDILKRQN